jgi:hypothetical protein
MFMSVKVDGFVPYLGTYGEKFNPAERPLTDQELNEIKARVKGKVLAKLSELNEIAKELSQIPNIKEAFELAQQLEELKTRREELKTTSEELKEKREELKTRYEEANIRLEAAKIKIEEGRKGAEEGRAMQRAGLTKIFYTIFKGKNDPAAKDLPAEVIERLFQTYLADGSLSIEKSPEGPLPRINTMKSVTQYLADHPNVISCDFRPFKKEMYDAKTFAEYLKTSSVKAIAIKKCVSEETKASLAEAVAARNGTLKVQYFD